MQGEGDREMLLNAGAAMGYLVEFSTRLADFAQRPTPTSAEVVWNPLRWGHDAWNILTVLGFSFRTYPETRLAVCIWYDTKGHMRTVRKRADDVYDFAQVCNYVVVQAASEYWIHKQQQEM